MMGVISLKECENFLQRYLNPAIEGQYVRLLYANSPWHSRQKYFLRLRIWHYSIRFHGANKKIGLR